MEILKLEPKDFPIKLQKIKDSPKQLYYIGNISLLYQDSFAIVGTRKITDYGVKICKAFSKEFSLRDIPIVSGMAIGTDTIAHKTAIEYGGGTIAVLGGGLERIFPVQNYDLFRRIIENGGLVLSEYENNVKPNKTTFPQRNRIVTAISEGVLVIEAAYRSGTSITANHAWKQEKKVFAIPGKIDSSLGIGTNILIKQGAILTTTISDILINYPQFMNKKRKSNPSKKIKKEYKKIYQILTESASSIDDLICQTDYKITDLLKILSNMQIENIIIQDMGVYKINEEFS